MNVLQVYNLVENFKEGDKIATMRLNQPISATPETGITARQFSSDFDKLVANGVQKIIITINSPGGNVFQGLEIFSTIQDSPIDTETRVVGIAASMAGIISQAGTKRTIKRHALWHGHSTRPAAGKTVSNSLLEITTGQIKEVLLANATLSESEVDAILSGETFLTAQKAKDAGLFDEVIESKVKRKLVSENMDVNDLMNVFNEIEYQKKETKIENKMSKVNELLNLNADANESAQIEAVETLKVEAAKATQLEEVKAEIVEKDAKIEELEGSLKAANSEKAATLIEAADRTLSLPPCQQALRTGRASPSSSLSSLRLASRSAGAIRPASRA